MSTTRAWEPEDGWQRTLSTTGGNLVVAVGFALMLAGLFTPARAGPDLAGPALGPGRLRGVLPCAVAGPAAGAAGYRRGRPGATPVLVDRHCRRHRGGPGPAGVRRQLAAEAGRRRPAGAAAPVRRAAARRSMPAWRRKPWPSVSWSPRWSAMRCSGPPSAWPLPGCSGATGAASTTACHPRPLPVAGP